MKKPNNHVTPSKGRRAMILLRPFLWRNKKTKTRQKYIIGALYPKLTQRIINFSVAWVVWNSASDSQQLPQVISFQELSWSKLCYLFYSFISNHGFCKRKRKKRKPYSYLARITWLLPYLEDIFPNITRRRIANNTKLTWKINKRDGSTYKENQ